MDLYSFAHICIPIGRDYNNTTLISTHTCNNEYIITYNCLS